MARHHDVPDLASYYLQATGSEADTHVGVDGEDGPRTHAMALDSTERPLFDLWAVETVRIAGTEIRYYPLDRSRSVRDPLYGEARQLYYTGPFRVHGLFSDMDTTQEMREEGLVIEVTGSLWLPRVELERVGMRPPVVSDIVEVWDLPYYALYKSSRAVTSVARDDGLFFDVTGVKEDGYIADTASFIGFVCTLRRSSTMPPERKLQSPKTVDGACV